MVFWDHNLKQMESNHQPLSSLDLPRFIVNSLHRQGFHNCDDFQEPHLRHKTHKLNFQNWTSLTGAPTPKSALDLVENELSWKPVRTLITELDSVLDKNITPGTITELCGLPGSGRTQICLHLAAGAGGEVVFIHTNRNLDRERLEEVALKYGSDVDAVLEKICCIEASDPVELTASVSYIENLLSEGNNIRLLIIDSLSWPVKQLVKEKRSFIYTLCQNLRSLATKFKFPIVVTNDMTTRILGNGEPYQTASLGDSFFHIINTRVLLSHERGVGFKAKVLKNWSGALQSEICFNF